MWTDCYRLSFMYMYIWPGLHIGGAQGYEYICLLVHTYMYSISLLLHRSPKSLLLH